MKRDPRNWKKDGHNYLIHAATGGICIAYLPLWAGAVLLLIGICLYQLIEYARAKDIRESDLNGWPKILDWISRDWSDIVTGGFIVLIVKTGIAVHLYGWGYLIPTFFI